jgi:phospholipase C
MAPVSAHEVQVGNVDQKNPDGTGLAYLGFRVPCILIGPRARRGSIAGAPYDANSILNLVTWRFGLPNIGVRATTSNNIAAALKLRGAAKAALPAPANLVNQVYGEACALNPMADLEMIERDYAEHFADLAKIDELMKQHGFRTA